MPANLTPEYKKVEQRYRAAKSPEEKIELLEEMLRVIPKHKGTDKMRGDLRRKLSKLKSSTQGKKGKSRHDSAYNIDKEGAGQAVVIGPANTGKSSLVAAMTNAEPEVSAVPFTTWSPMPGMMPIGNIQVQLIDTPPLNPEHVESGMLDLIRRSDLVLLVIDLNDFPIEQFEHAIELLEERNIAPLQWQDRYPEERRRTLVPFLVLVNKNDDESTDEDFQVLCELLEDGLPLIPISVTMGRNIDAMKKAIFERLGVIRVYSKAPGREADQSAPFILKEGTNIEEFAGKVHKDFLDNLKQARVWGSSAFEGQMVARDYILQDGDIVELRM
jgi:ribosome-interacting GTPase 1